MRLSIWQNVNNIVPTHLERDNRQTSFQMISLDKNQILVETFLAGNLFKQSDDDAFKEKFPK